MEVKEKYIQKYWHEIVRDQIMDELREQGFEVYPEYEIDGYVADLYAEREGEKRIIEIKKNALSRDAFIKLHGFALERRLMQMAIVCLSLTRYNQSVIRKVGQRATSRYSQRSRNKPMSKHKENTAMQCACLRNTCRCFKVSTAV